MRGTATKTADAAIREEKRREESSLSCEHLKIAIKRYSKVKIFRSKERRRSFLLNVHLDGDMRLTVDARAAGKISANGHLLIDYNKWSVPWRYVSLKYEWKYGYFYYHHTKFTLHLKPPSVHQHNAKKNSDTHHYLKTPFFCLLFGFFDKHTCTSCSS